MDVELWISGGIVVALLVTSAFFSASETALTAASKPLMHQLERDGNHKAGFVNRLLEHKERLLATLLLGNNLANIAASALATSVLISLFGDAGVIYATAGMTVLVLIFAEVFPKTYALEHANRTALVVAGTVRLMLKALLPVVTTLELVVRGAVRLIGGKHGTAGVFDAASAELRGAIDLHAGEDEAHGQERAMLRSILDLADVEVSEIMVHRKNMTTIDIDQPPLIIVEQVLASPFTRIPLWQEEPDNIIGVLHAKALLRALNSKGGELDRLDIVDVAGKPWFIPESTSLLIQLQAFRRRREHFALVVDEYGTLGGIVTLEDILEEIVGDIADEHDLPVAGVRPQPDGSFVVDGSVTIRDLNRQFEWNLPDEDYATIAGLVLHEARRIPDVGQEFRFFGFRFEILRRHRNQILSLRVAPASGEED